MSKLRSRTFFERIWTRFGRGKAEQHQRKEWPADWGPPMRPESTDLDPKIAELVHEAWSAFTHFAEDPFIVKPSIPILFFGHTPRYFSSPLKVVTLGLNPSGIEFPEHDRFLRFRKAQHLDPRVQDESFVSTYLDALNGYFQSPPNHPYKPWFNSFEPVLQGLDCSYYGGATSTALHTDICSPFATSPTWSKLPSEVQSRFMQPGSRLWHALIEWLSPDVIIASVARSHLNRVSFAREASWQVIHTVDRENPYKVELSSLRRPDGKRTYLVFGKAANTPFGTVSNVDKRRIGEALRSHITQAQRVAVQLPERPPVRARGGQACHVAVKAKGSATISISPIEEMARGCYGYGNWEAPYWYIGLEEGMDGELDDRIRAWRELGAETGLSDCRAFHRKIGVDKWHRSEEKAALQSTWKQLIRVLLASRGENTEPLAIRHYQCNEWGKAKGETCVIELSGLPAKGLKEGVTLRGQHFTPEQVEQILHERTAAIRQKILTNRPRFVVMYGMIGKRHFERLAGQSLIRDQVVIVGPTKMVLTQHPVAQGSANEDWIALGKKLG